MKLLDSNIIIYAAAPKYGFLRKMIAETNPFISIVSKIEVLGYHLLAKEEKHYLENIFAVAPLLNITDDIVEKSITLRQHKKFTLADSIIAATALVHGLELVTRNTDDFLHIPKLRLFNPFIK